MTDAPAKTPAETAAKTPDSAAGAPPPYKHLYLVDGSGYIFRAFFAIPPRMTSHGVHTNAVFGFTNMLIKLLRETDADGLAVVFDHSGESFRNTIYADYKANRDEPPEELVPQFAAIREATRAFGLPCLEQEGYEADDLIATYARQASAQGIRVTIVSSDKDLMQLVGDGVDMLDPMKERAIGREQVIEKFGVPPEQVIDVQALAGDSTDNVPGVPGIGIKTAAQLIEAYGSLEALLERAAEIKQPKRRERLIENAELARISKKLVTLDTEVPVEVALSGFGLREPDPAALRGFLEHYEFRSILNRLADKLGPDGGEGLVPDEKEAGRAPGGADGGPERGADNGGGPAKAPAPAERAPGTGYATVQSAAALEDWVARATAAGRVAVDTETDSLDSLRARLVGVSLAVAPGEACYIPLGHTAAGADGETLDFDAGTAPEQIPLEQALEILRPAAGRPGGAEDRSEPEVRSGGAAPLRRRSHADRRHHAAVLRAGGRPARPWHGRAVEAAPRPHADPLQGGLRRRQVADHLRPGAAGARHRLRRRGRRRHPAPARAVQAAARGRAGDPRLRDPGAAAGAGARRHGGDRHQGRPRPAQAAVQRLRRAPGRAGGRDPRPGRPHLQHRQPQAARRDPVRRAGPGPGQEGQDRRLRHRRRGAGAARRPGPRAAGPGARLAPGGQAEVDLLRRAAGPDQPGNRARAHLLRPGRGLDRGDCPRPTPICRTSRYAPRPGARSATPSSPRPAASC